MNLAVILKPECCTPYEYNVCAEKPQQIRITKARKSENTKKELCCRSFEYGPRDFSFRVFKLSRFRDSYSFSCNGRSCRSAKKECASEKRSLAKTHSLAWVGRLEKSGIDESRHFFHDQVRPGDEGKMATVGQLFEMDVRNVVAEG